MQVHSQLTGRRESLDRICTIIRSRTSPAVFLMAAPGIGKSTVIDALTRRLSTEMTVLRIHGSSSLAHVPYGVLAPYTSGLSAEESVSPIAVLRSVWTYFQQLKSAKDAPMLLVVDDAHHLDEATASIIVDMISARWASVLAAGRPRPGLPQALNQLWYDGLAERIDLQPLNRDQVTEVMAHSLDGSVPEDTVNSFWSASGGNPLLLECLLHDAMDQGVLVKRNGIWLLLAPLHGDGPGLAAVASKALLCRSAEEQEALKLIALAEPVRRSLIEEICGAGVVRSLLDHQAIAPGNSSELRLYPAVFGQALRGQISISRSLQLRGKLWSHLGAQAEGSEGRLRAVEWSLECGLDVPAADLLEAAARALDMSRNTSAHRLASRVSDPRLVPRAQAIMARALFNGGNYADAADLLDDCWLPMASDPEAAHILMLRAAAHLALGKSALQLRAESREQLSADGSDPVQSWQDTIHAFLELAASGDHVGLQSIVESLEDNKPDANKPGTNSPGAAAVAAIKTVGLALLAQTVIGAGRPEQGISAARQAAAGLASLQHGLYFFNEFVLSRLVEGYLAAGEWESAQRELASYSAGHAPGPTSFSGGVQLLRGLACLRQGRIERAYQLLLPALETLRVNDPLQQFRLGSALGFYAAARLGDAAQARRLELDYKGATHASSAASDLAAAGYVAAASEYLAGDGKGLAALHTLTTTLQAAEMPGVLLECLALCSELGDHSVMPLIGTVAEGIEGRWASGLLSLSGAWVSDDADSLMTVASDLEQSGLANLAREAYSKASAILEKAGEHRRSRQAVALREKCDHELGERFRTGSFIASVPTFHLTRRERDIIELAINGLTDREIAQKLMVSVRTVEGHLYRSYVKLGVRRRDELTQALPKG
ncbi:LuxR C-terminal-related transcriptional regulator [Pseudarthrobacter sp. N5]|uniref:helix-turn-helix transcriptional regulator n=1 Tax=Pseudarthrobacter sp. N5 TaxID=3418416 RepID=UPI003CF945CC